MAIIHPTAIIDPQAELGTGVEIGPYVVIRGKVTLGDGTVVHEHSVLRGETIIGRNCAIGPAAGVGLDPQHRGYKGEVTRLVIGDDVVVREMVTVHRSYYPDPTKATRVGNRCYLMATCHVGHDAAVGDDVTIANAALLAGHVTIGNNCFIGGAAGLHQFIRIGRLAVVGGACALSQDIPPFGAADLSFLKGYNAVGLRRSGMPAETIQAVRKVYRNLHAHRSTTLAIQAIREACPDLPEVREILEFITTSKRGIVPSARRVRSHMMEDKLED